MRGKSEDHEFVKQKLAEIQTSLLTLIKAVDDSTEMCANIMKLLRFHTDRQHYLNSYNNLEYLLHKKYPGGGILLCGNYGEPNNGDEWMLRTLLDYLTGYTKKHITVMLVPDRNYDISAFGDIDFIHFPQTLTDSNILADQYDELIFGGGTLIEDLFYKDAYDFGIPVCRILVDLSMRFIAKDKDVRCIGLSAARQLKNVEYIQKLQYVIDQSKQFSVRDDNSIKTLESSGIRCEKIVLMHDIMFANEQIMLYRRSRMMQNKNVKNIGIVWILNDETKDTLTEMLCRLARWYGEDIQIALIPFNDSRHNDQEHLKQVKCPRCVRIYDYTSDLAKTLKIISRQDIMINMRYHAMLLSMAAGITCVNILYDVHPHYWNKVDYLMRQFGFSKGADECAKFSEINKISKESFEGFMRYSNGEMLQNIVQETKDYLEHFRDSVSY